MNEAVYEFFATCLPGAERLLADELHGLGVKKVRPLSGGASFFGAPEDALRVCLWSRLAGRVNLTVGRVAARDADALYAGVRELPWETVIADGASIAVRASGTNAELRNTQFVALKVKDAICDRLAETRGARPDVKPQQPDALVEVRLREEKASLSLDLSGRSLTRRAYLGDEAGEEAPSVVSQAATLLAAVGAAELFAEGTTFLDPVDVDSILAREAAEVREDRAPGLLRERWGFTGWTAFPDKAWGDLLDEADERCEARMALLATAPACPDAPRLVASVASVFRADDDAEAVAVRAACVAASREAPAGSRFAFAGFEGMAAKFKEEPTVRLKLGRGRSETTVEVFDRPPRRPSVISVANPAGGADIPVEVNDPAAAQFASRLRKVARERRKWAAREGVACYRLYDADVPEYACAIDLYEGAAEAEGELYAHVAEYAPPKSVDPEQAHARFEDVLALVPVVLGIPPEHVFSKSRLRAKGGGQYRDAGGRRFVTHTSEDGLICEIDLGGYLDTGIFLDHRVTREMVGKMAAGKRFLNLFAYTGVATLHAAAGGAKETTTVDLSQTYLDWAARNLAANGSPSKLLTSRIEGIERTEVRRGVGGEGRPTSSFAPTSLAGSPKRAAAMSATTLSSWIPRPSPIRRPWADAPGTCSATMWSCSSASRVCWPTGEWRSSPATCEPSSPISRSWRAAAWNWRTLPPRPFRTISSETSASTNAIWCAENNFRLRGK